MCRKKNKFGASMPSNCGKPRECPRSPWQNRIHSLHETDKNLWRISMKMATGLSALMFGAFVFTSAGVYTGPAAAESLHSYCDNYAYGEARSRGRNRVKGGSLLGAATGAIIGGIAGGGRGAAIGAGAGAAAGAAGGAASKKVRRNKVYKRAYRDCIRTNS